MAAQAWFTSSDTEVAPGSVTVLQLTIANLSASTDTFTITPSGLAAAWTTVRPASVTLFGGSQQEVEVRVAPPLHSGTTAGSSLLSVRIVPHSDPDAVTGADTTLHVTATDERTLTLLQPVLRTRRQADYEVLLENHGNAQATCRLQLVEPSGRIVGTFDPASVTVAPGTSGLVRLRVRATRRLWKRRSRTLPFRVDAEQAGSATVATQGTFVQAPVLADRVLPRMGAVIVVAAVVLGGWFGLVRPTIDDAAERAVRDVVGSASDVTPTSGNDSGSSGSSGSGDGSPSQVIVAEAAGDITNFALHLAVSAGSSGTDEFVVPDGMRLLVTDIVVQNPYLDQGTLQVLRDDESLATYGLANVFADVGLPLVTPIELAAGQHLVASLECVGVGDPVIGTCSPSILVSGRLVPT